MKQSCEEERHGTPDALVAAAPENPKLLLPALTMWNKATAQILTVTYYLKHIVFVYYWDFDEAQTTFYVPLIQETS